VPHDAYDPVGFLLRTPDGNIGFLTDLGHPTKLVMQRVREAHVLVLETNHDLKLLQDDTRRPWSTKQRIMSRHGHLSNDAAASLVTEIVSERLQHLYLGHLSSDCNRPALAHDCVAATLAKAGVTHVRIQAASPNIPCATLEFSYQTRTVAPLFAADQLFRDAPRQLTFGDAANWGWPAAKTPSTPARA
jgi:hypothetical protein